jgi:hypothetical protein
VLAGHDEVFRVEAKVFSKAEAACTIVNVVSGSRSFLSWTVGVNLVCALLPPFSFLIRTLFLNALSIYWLAAAAPWKFPREQWSL